MESGRFLFDPPACTGNMLYLGDGGRVLRGASTMISMGVQDNQNGRPFFRSPDLFDEEYYDEFYPEKKRRLTHDQVEKLEKSFEEENKLEPDRKGQLAKKLGLQPRQVAVWFQNRRARWKTKQLETDYDLLKAAYHSLLSNYDSVVQDNELLKSKVVSLTEKLQAKELDGVAAFPVITSEPLSLNIPHISADHSSGKVEDGLSSRSDTSVVVDGHCLQLVDSGDSNFLNDKYHICVPPTTGLQLEDDGNSFFSDVFAAADHNHEDEHPAWWGWS